MGGADFFIYLFIYFLCMTPADWLRKHCTSTSRNSPVHSPGNATSSLSPGRKFVSLTGVRVCGAL